MNRYEWNCEQFSKLSPFGGIGIEDKDEIKKIFRGVLSMQWALNCS